MNIYLDFTIITIHISCCLCFVGYEMFQGFDYETSNNTSDTELPSTNLGERRGFGATVFPHYNNFAASTITEHKVKQAKKIKEKMTTIITIPTTTDIHLLPVKATRFNCSEDEKPINIGPYEVPTQRDLVQLIRKILIRGFNTYQQKALKFLKDIQVATKATSEIAKKCHAGGRDHVAYQKCVKRVSVKCKLITKSLITTLETQREDVSAFIEGTICNVTVMKADPVQLIKTLAMDEASLEFALPGFLRLLSACSVYCDKGRGVTTKLRKPLRHMTDQDLVVKHFLTKKNYLQLLKGSK